MTLEMKGMGVKELRLNEDDYQNSAHAHGVLAPYVCIIISHECHFKYNSSMWTLIPFVTKILVRKMHKKKFNILGSSLQQILSNFCQHS